MALQNNADIGTVLRILQQIPLMKELNEADHKAIIDRIVMEYYPKNYFIFKEGDPGDAFYIIKRGIVRIFHEASSKAGEKEVTMLGDNDFFGEMSLISERSRNATSQAMEDSEIFRLKKEDFIQLLSSQPDMANRISIEFLKRLKINIKT